jgi:hypothetical protein
MSSAPKTKQYLIDRFRFKYSWAAGAARGTPAAIEWQRRDLDIAFAEINGLMAGLHYQDEAEPTPADAQQYPAAISDEDLQVSAGTATQDHPSVADPVQGVEHLPMASQWAAIRSLRQETAFHHERFQQLARDLGDATISKLLDTYPDARSVRNKGAQLVKDVLEGFQPRDLSLVFAFASFAYAISQLLYKRGRIDKSEILADLQVWRDLISDPRERDAFNLIAQNLWPEAKDHLHFIPIPSSCVGSHMHLPFPHLPTRHATPPDGTLAARETVCLAPDFPFPFPPSSQAGDPQLNLLSSTLELADYAYFGEGHTTSHDDPGNVPADFDMLFGRTIRRMSQSNAELDFAALEPVKSLFPQPLTSGSPPSTSLLGEGIPSRQQGTTSSGPPGGRREQEPPEPIKQAPDELKLDDTGMFLAVLVFLQEIAELVFILSGRIIASRRQKLYKVEERDQEAFYLSALDTFFEPRRRRQDMEEPEALAFQALLFVAEKFSQAGLLRAIAEIKHYLVDVAAVSLCSSHLVEEQHPDRRD